MLNDFASSEVKEVITPYGRSGSEETIVILHKT